MSNKGYIYVLINPSLKGMVKIGKTTRDSEERAKELSNSTGVPTPFTVAYEVFVEDCTKAEEYIHTKLEESGYKVNKNREFFNIPLKKVIPLMLELEKVINSEDDIKSQNFAEIMDFSCKGKYYKDKALKYLRGIDNYPQDDLKAFEYLKKSVELDHIYSYDLLAYMYSSGKGCEKDYTKSLEYYQKSINSGLKDCYYSLTYLLLEINQLELAFKCRKIFKQSDGFKILSDDLRERDEKAFQETLEESRNKQISKTLTKKNEHFNLTSPAEKFYNEAITYFNFKNDIPQNNVKAYELFNKAAEYNFYLSYPYLSNMLHYALGCTEDLDKALDYHFKMLNLDVSDFEGMTSILLDKGQVDNANICWEKYLNDDSFMELSVEEQISKKNDFEIRVRNIVEHNKVKHHFSQDNKHGEELYNEALKYFNGDDDYLQDYYEALRLFKQSAKLGFSLSYLYLAILYKNGLLGDKNLDKALENSKKGLDGGVDMAYKIMAEIYLEKQHLDNAKKCWVKYKKSWYFQNLPLDDQKLEEKDFNLI